MDGRVAAGPRSRPRNNRRLGVDTMSAGGFPDARVFRLLSPTSDSLPMPEPLCHSAPPRRCIRLSVRVSASPGCPSNHRHGRRLRANWVVTWSSLTNVSTISTRMARKRPHVHLDEAGHHLVTAAALARCRIRHKTSGSSAIQLSTSTPGPHTGATSLRTTQVAVPGTEWLGCCRGSSCEALRFWILARMLVRR